MSAPITHETAGEAQTVALGVRMAKGLRAGDVVALRGELGAGKTRFVRGLARGLGHDPAMVSSPTFTLLHEYDTPGEIPLVHVDAYRLSSLDDPATIGLDRAFDGTTIVVIEWPERLGSMLPAERFDVLIEHEAPERRTITVTPPAGRTIDLGPAAALRCRICQQPTSPDDPAFPFCSPRCRLVDLGKWMGGEYRVTRNLKDSDLETND